jgi:hypothetical protein
MGNLYHRLSIKQAFQMNIDCGPIENDGCWTWIGGLGPGGYGRFQFNKRRIGAHRASYELYIGPIPKGLCVCHKCDNRVCVNPKHFFLGTIAENNLDKYLKGRHGKGESVSNKGMDNGASKLTDDEVKEIKKLLRQGISQQKIADRFGVAQTNISLIKRGLKWKHID